MMSRLTLLIIVCSHLYFTFLVILLYFVYFTYSLLVAVILETLAFVVLPYEFLELSKVAKQRNSSASVHKSRFQDPKIAACFCKKCFRAGSFAIEITL